MRPFEYASAATREQAVRLLGTEPGRSAVLAGGSNLLSRMKDGVESPARLVDLKSVAGLAGVRQSEGGGVRIGALSTLDDLATDAALGWDYPALIAALGRVATPQVRNVATLGGNLCQRSSGVHLSTLAPLLIALGARIALFGPGGERRIPLQSFYRVPQSEGEREYDLQPGELLTEIELTPVGGRKVGSYEVRAREALEWPLASAAVALEWEGDKVTKARVVLGQVAPVPWVAAPAEEFLVGKPIDAGVAQKAGEAALQGVQELPDNRAKIQQARVAVERALLAAVGRLEGGI
jgi:xanthine dehydrogenase YagS FAD-binding subunit